MNLQVKLETFEGPLDLLLHLIEKNKVNIYDIPISEITNQYLDYIRQMQRQDLNIMSEFLVMAATLLDIKSKLLLPAEEVEEGETQDPRTELVEQLLQYKMYKFIAYELKDRQIDAQRSYYKEPNFPKEVLAYEEPIDMESLCAEMNLKKLNDIFQSIMKKQVERIDPVRAKFGKIEKEEISMEDAILQLEEYAKIHKEFSFRKHLMKQKNKMAVIVSFLAVLELMKIGKICILQEELFDDITITSCIAA